MTLGNVGRDLEMVRQSTRKHNVQSSLRLASALLVVFTFTTNHSLAVGQEKPAGEKPAEEADAPKGYTVIPGKLPKSIIGMAKSGQVSNQTEFDNYYKALIAQFTQPEQFAAAYDLRRNLRRDARTAYSSKSSKQFHTALNQLLLSTLRDLVTDPLYHPATRFNWILIIGELNEAEKLAAGTAKEKPLPGALPVLISVAGDESQVDSVRLAALIGLDRHAKAGSINAEAKQTLAPILQKTIARRSPPEGRDPEVHQWFQDRARGILEALGIKVAEIADTPDAPDGPDSPDAADGPDGPDGP